MKITVNAMGDTCPIPLIKTKNAIRELNGAEAIVETLVDNEIAVQNLMKIAGQMKYQVRSEKLGDQQFRVEMNVGAGEISEISENEEALNCTVDHKRKHCLVVISSRYMGDGDEVLGAILMKGFLYAISQQEELPETILFYNGGAYLTCEESASLEDLKSMEAQGVEIMTCGTCLNHYGLEEQLQVGTVTNMYVIAEKMSQASQIIKP